VCATEREREREREKALLFLSSVHFNSLPLQGVRPIAQADV
jgi:hypothetical protein